MKAGILKKIVEKRRKYLIRRTYWILNSKIRLKMLIASFIGEDYCALKIGKKPKLSFFILKKKLEANGFKCRFSKDWLSRYLCISW